MKLGHQPPTTNHQPPATDPNLQRIRRNAIVLLAILGTFAFVAAGWSIGASVLLGGLLAFLNMSWLHSAVDGFLGAREMPAIRIVVGGLGVRLLLILLVFFAIIHTSFLSVLGALVGFSVFILSGFLEAILLAVKGDK